MNRISKIAASLLLGASIATASGMTANAATNDPFAEMERVFQMQMQQMKLMQQHMDRLFQNFEKNFQTPAIMQTPILVHSSGVLSSGFQDKGDHYELQIKVNDLKDSEVKISTENHMLTIAISAKKKVEKQEGNYGKIISYTNSSSVQSFTLPSDADPASIEAKQKDNTITITIKKKPGAKVIPLKKENTSAASAKPETPQKEEKKQ